MRLNLYFYRMGEHVYNKCQLHDHISLVNLVAPGETEAFHLSHPQVLFHFHRQIMKISIKPRVVSVLCNHCVQGHASVTKTVVCSGRFPFTGAYLRYLPKLLIAFGEWPDNHSWWLQHDFEIGAPLPFCFSYQQHHSSFFQPVQPRVSPLQVSDHTWGPAAVLYWC